MAELGHIHRDYSLNDAQRREMLRTVIESARTNLSPAMQRLFNDCVVGWMNGGSPPSELELQLPWIPDYISKPVGIREFIHNPVFLGQALGESIYAPIENALEELFDGNYPEVVLAGAIGWGKTRMAQVGILYDLYLVSCLRDPAAAYGLIPSSTLAFVAISVRLQQATKVFFNGLYSLVRSSFYFRETFPYAPNLRSELCFPNNITAYPVAANEQAMLGEGVFAAVFDEMNFMAVVEDSKRTVPGEASTYDQAVVLSDKLSRRIRSRFNLRGKLPGKIWYISSSRYPGDFTERKELEALEQRRSGGRLTIFVRHYSQWETKPEHMFMSTKFKVEVGDLTRRSRVLTGEETDVDPARVIEVPTDFYNEFKRDPDGAVRDYAGVPTLSITPFIVNRGAIHAMFDNGAKAGLKPVFTKLEVILQGPAAESEHLLPENLHWVYRQKENEYGEPVFEDRQRTRPLIEKKLFSALRYAHIDLSKTRCATGLVVAHAVGAKKVPRLDDETLKTVFETMPIIRVELALRVVPPRGGEIDIPRVRAIIHQLRNQGVEFGLVTFDTYGSQESVKALKDAGFTADVYSLEDNLTPWEELKQALYDGRLQCYEFPQLAKELAQLELVKGKIEKPAHAGAAKDIADCLAAVVHHVEEGWRKAAGSLGMFQLGVVERPGQIAEPSPLGVAATPNWRWGSR